MVYLAQIVGYPGATVRMAHLRAPAGECIIELFEYVQPASIDVALEPARVGNAYVCFLLLDLDSVYDRLRARGVESLSAPVTIDTGVNTGGRAIYLRESGAGISGVSSFAEILPRGAYRRREVVMDVLVDRVAGLDIG